jgi:hypothetical protein
MSSCQELEREKQGLLWVVDRKIAVQYLIKFLFTHVKASVTKDSGCTSIQSQ